MTKSMIVDSIAKAHSDPLLRYLTRKLGSAAEAEDIAQEAFCRLHTVRDIESVENPKAYLFRIANNLIVEKYRVTPKAALESIDGPAGQAVCDATADPERIIMSRQQLSKVATAIEGLPERCREAFVLQRFYNLSHKEIAARMGISVKTVEKHVAKGLLYCHAYVNDINAGNVATFPTANSGRGLDE